MTLGGIVTTNVTATGVNTALIDGVILTLGIPGRLELLLLQVLEYMGLYRPRKGTRRPHLEAHPIFFYVSFPSRKHVVTLLLSLWMLRSRMCVSVRTVRSAKAVGPLFFGSALF